MALLYLDDIICNCPIEICCLDNALGLVRAFIAAFSFKVKATQDLKKSLLLAKNIRY